MKRIYLLFLIFLVVSGLYFVVPRPEVNFRVPPRPPALSEEKTALLHELKTTYGPKHYSQHTEEWIIRHFYQDKENGVFLDVGANDYKKNSTTYYLDQKLNWTGVAIDALAQFAEAYVEYRPNTQYFTFFVSNRSDEKAKFYVVESNHRLSSAVLEVVEKREHHEIEVPTITLNDLLSELKIEKIDFLSMDIERWEPQALEGFDIDKYQPSLVCIEAHEMVKEDIIYYFASHGYVRIEEYVGLDPLNWYYTPLSEQSDSPDDQS